MRVSEAYKVLGISDTSSKEDAKKAFKKLAAKYHPDVNKEPDAETKFKEVNTAMQVIESGKGSDHEDDVQPGHYWSGGSSHGNGVAGVSLEDLIGNFGGFGFAQQGPRRKPIAATDIYLTDTISFRESVLGCTKEIKFTRNAKCEVCDGAGQKSIDNGCTKCGGRGVVIQRNGNMITQMQCNKCRGISGHQPCHSCNSNGFIQREHAITVRFPSGISPDKNVLRLGHCGNYMGSAMMMEQYTQVFLTVDITPQDGLSLEGNDVVSGVSISLLDALRGCVRSVPTIDGARDAIIPEGTRNKGEVILNNLGVARSGNQRVIVDVEYPTDTTSLIEFLLPKPVESAPIEEPPAPADNDTIIEEATNDIQDGL